MKIKDRISAKSPKLFQKITNVCIMLGVVGGVILAAPVSLPLLITTIGGYMVVAGSIGASVSKLTVSDTVDEDER